MNARSPDSGRLCVHTITTKPWPIETAIDRYARAGIRGITVWRQALEGRDPRVVGGQIRSSGLSVASLCRGGFFPGADDSSRRAAIDDNRRCIDEAAALGAPLIVLVCGAVPGISLQESRRQITEGIAAVLPHAAAAGVRLAIEPLHPMYADNRSAINTMAQARKLCDELASPWLGIALDVYHAWWDESLLSEIIASTTAGRLFAFHVSDWLTPTSDLLNDRGLMGEGCIPIREIRGWVDDAGYSGFLEVEIFSKRHWARDQDAFLADILAAYRDHA